MSARNRIPSLPSPMSRRGFLTLSAAGSLGLLAGCGGGKGVGDTGAQGVGGFTGSYDGPKLDLAYWNGFTGGDGPAMKALVEKFNQENPKIAVKPNTVQWADFYQRLPAAAQAGKGPDVGAMHLDQLATNAARKVIVPLDDLAESLKLSESDFTEEVWKPGIYQGKRYGIPLDVHCLAMYWNKDHFEKAGITEAPTDAASFDEACQKLKKAGFDTPFWVPNQWPGHLMFLSILWQNGGAPYADDGSEATYADQAGTDALGWMTDQIKKGYSPPNVDIDAQYTAFKNGKTSITWDGIWQLNDLAASGLPFGVAPVPAVGKEPAVWANSHHFFLTEQAAKDKNRANASKTFIGWMSKQSSDWSEAGMIPARNSAREEAAFTDSPQSVFADYLPNLRFLPPVPGLGDVQPQTLEVAVNQAVLGKASPEAALTKSATNASKLMQSNLDKFGSA